MQCFNLRGKACCCLEQLFAYEHDEKYIQNSRLMYHDDLIDINHNYNNNDNDIKLQ